MKIGSHFLALCIWIIIFILMIQSNLMYRCFENAHTIKAYGGIREIEFEECVLVCEQNVEMTVDNNIDEPSVPIIFGDDVVVNIISKPTNITLRERDLLERIAFFEAGTEGVDGMRRVVDVVLNRVRSDKFPDTIEEVLMQDGQFATVKSNGFFGAHIPESARAAVMKETEVGANNQLDSVSLYFARSPITVNGVYRYGRHYFSY